MSGFVDNVVREITSKFRFDQRHRGLMGVEREWFLVDTAGKITPRAVDIIPLLDPTQTCPELSACQLEAQVGPLKLGQLACAIHKQERYLSERISEHGLRLLVCEVAPENIPMDVYPTKRYEDIAQRMIDMGRLHVLRAGCRITGTHVHRAVWLPDGVDMPLEEAALKIYNHAVTRAKELAVLGDHSGGERIRLYKEMMPDPWPKPYDSWAQYCDRVWSESDRHDPKDIWDLIRFSTNGTIEFRMFGTTSDVGEIVDWATRCDEICREAFL